MINEKPCKECGEMFVRYKTFDKYCSYACKKKNEKASGKKRTRIKPIADKRAEELAIYRKTRDAYLKEITECEVHDCNNKATHIHHKNGRRGKMLYDSNYFMSVCNACHPQKIHENPEWSRAMGYLI
jgi:hypothetical protein